MPSAIAQAEHNNAEVGTNDPDDNYRDAPGPQVGEQAKFGMVSGEAVKDFGKAAPGMLHGYKARSNAP